MAFGLGLCSCGDEEEPSAPVDPGPQGRDFLGVSVDGGTEITYIEASGLPDIDCDPRVDWSASQVILWDDFTDGSGPSGYELNFEVMFPLVDGVGTYTVHGDYIQVFFYNGTSYMASPVLASSNGTVTVTRSDDRIEGTYIVTVVNADETDSIALSGHFGVGRGFALSCL